MQQIILYLVSSVFGCNSPEQVAFEYFAEKIVKDRYPESKTIYFSGCSEPRESMEGPFWDCFDSTYFKEYRYKNKGTTSNTISIKYEHLNYFKLNKHPRKGKLYLRIYRTARENQFSYTYIKVYKMYHFVDHYLVKSSTETKKVIDVCRKSEII